MARKKSDIDRDDVVGFFKAIFYFGLMAGFAMTIAYGVTFVIEPSDPGFVVGENSSEK